MLPKRRPTAAAASLNCAAICHAGAVWNLCWYAELQKAGLCARPAFNALYSAFPPIALATVWPFELPSKLQHHLQSLSIYTQMYNMYNITWLLFFSSSLSTLFFRSLTLNQHSLTHDAEPFLQRSRVALLLLLPACLAACSASILYGYCSTRCTQRFMLNAWALGCWVKRGGGKRA